MPRPSFKAPRPPEPLPAVMAGAGFFVFLAALTGVGPFQAMDRALWRLSLPGEAQAASRAALRVQGRAQPLSGTARVEALAEDLAWLRRSGAGAIVLEAWLDEAPQADARLLAEALHERFQFLSPPARAAALAALAEVRAEVDATPRLEAALGAAQPLLLAWQAVPGSGPALPSALTAQGYEVTLRGQRQRLPEMQALRLPWPGALQAVARSGACAAQDGEGRLPAVLEMQGRWYNALGLEAARLSLGLPLEDLRYRWRRGALSSLELQGVRYPLDERGGLRLPGRPLRLDQAGIEDLRAMPGVDRADLLAGRVVFFRPWPQQEGGAELFEQQQRLFTALVERWVDAPPPGAPRRLAWVAGWAGGVLAWGLLPAWAGALVWAVLPAAAVYAFAQDPQGLAEPLSLALSSLLLGLGWGLQRRRRRLLEAEQELKGRVGSRHLVAWKKRLAGGQAAHEGVYAVLGPQARLQGAWWEAWMERWGGFLEPDLKVDGLGVVFADPDSRRLALQALQALRTEQEGLTLSLGLGMVRFQAVQRLGARHWELSGPGRDAALRLHPLAKPGQCLFLESDYPGLREWVQVQVLGQALELEPEKPVQTLNLLSLTGKL